MLRNHIIRQHNKNAINAATPCAFRRFCDPVERSCSYHLPPKLPNDGRSDDPLEILNQKTDSFRNESANEQERNKSKIELQVKRGRFAICSAENVAYSSVGVRVLIFPRRSMPLHGTSTSHYVH